MNDNTDFFTLVTKMSHQENNQYVTESDDKVIDEPVDNPLVYDIKNAETLLEMPAVAKRTLVYLMRHGVVLQSEKPQVFANILVYKEMIIRHLSEVYLSLMIDERQGIIFIARSDYFGQDSDVIDDDMNDNDENISSLINRRTLSVYDTLLLLVLRKYYQERENAGEQQIVIDIEKLADLLSPFLPLTNYESKDKNKLLARVKGLLKPHKIVQSIRNSDERFEITPMIRYVVNADFLQTMLVEYQELLAENKKMKNDEISTLKSPEKTDRTKQKHTTDELF